MLEFKDIVYIAVSFILVAILLEGVSRLMTLRTQMSAARNIEIESVARMGMYRKYNMYNGTELNGDMVLSAITEFSTGEIEVYVRNIGGNTSHSILLNKANLKSNPSAYSLVTLDPSFDASQIYKAYLVYDFNDVTTVSTVVTPNENAGVVTGLAFIFNRFN